jgi:hypothetical protein
VLGGLAKPSADCTQRAVSPPGRTAACACDCIGLGFVFFLFMQRPSPTVAASTGSPGCAGYTALAPTTTPNGRVPAPSDCGLANWRRLHTVCSEPARANCSMCDPVLVAGWGFFKKKRAGLHCYWRPLRSLHQRLGTCTQVQIARTWLKAGTERTATRCSEPGRAICIVCLGCAG